jgi:ribose transport system permease protein
LLGVTGVLDPSFVSDEALLAIAFNMAVVGVLSAGVAVLVISGGLLDLSIPTSTGLSALCTAVVLNHVGSWPAAIAGIACGCGIGLTNGLLIVATKVNPIVITLAVNFAGEGVLNMAFGQEFPLLKSGLHDLGLSNFIGVPTITWLMFGVLLLTGLGLSHTRYGRRAIAVGGNSIAAKRQGISLARARIATFGFMGLCAGIAGVLYASQSQIISPGDTSDLLFPAITAVILSGFSLQGGRGSFPVLILGIGLLSTIPTSLIALGATPDWTQLAQGLLLVFAVSLDGFRIKRGRR